MGDHALLARLQAGEARPARRVHARATTRSRSMVIEHGGLFPFTKAFARGRGDAAARRTPRRGPMTMAEKILAAPPGRRGRARVRQAGRRGLRARRRRLLARVHHRAGALLPGAGVRARLPRWPTRPSSRSSRTTSSTPTAWRGWRRSRPKIETLRDMQREFQQQDRRARLLGARRRLARHLPQGRARADHRARATSSRPPTATPAWAARCNALAYGVGATEYAALVHCGLHVRRGAGVDPLRARRARCRPGVTAKDVMLHILANYAQAQETLDRVMEFGGPGLRHALARRARDARQHGHRVLGQGRRGARPTRRCSTGSPRAGPGVDRRGAAREGGGARPGRRLRRRRARRSTSRRSGRWSRRPGDPDHGHPVRPHERRLVDELGDVPHRHRLRRLVHRGQGGRPRPLRARDGARRWPPAGAVTEGVDFFIQFGSRGGRGVRARAGLPRRLRADGRAGHPPRLRRLHRLRARRLRRAPTRSRSRPSTATTRTARARASSTSPRRSPSPPPRSRAASSRTARGCSPRPEPRLTEAYFAHAYGPDYEKRNPPLQVALLPGRDPAPPPGRAPPGGGLRVRAASSRRQRRFSIAWAATPRLRGAARRGRDPARPQVPLFRAALPDRWSRAGASTWCAAFDVPEHVPGPGAALENAGPPAGAGRAAGLHRARIRWAPGSAGGPPGQGPDPRAPPRPRLLARTPPAPLPPAALHGHLAALRPAGVYLNAISRLSRRMTTAPGARRKRPRAGRGGGARGPRRPARLQRGPGGCRPLLARLRPGVGRPFRRLAAVVVVDDGSATARPRPPGGRRALGARGRPPQQPRPGRGHALRPAGGLEQAEDDDIVVTMDADDTHAPGLISRMTHADRGRQRRRHRLPLSRPAAARVACPAPARAQPRGQPALPARLSHAAACATSPAATAPTAPAC